MPKKHFRKIRKHHNPELLEKLHAKTSALSENRLTVKSRKDLFQKTSSEEENNNLHNLTKAMEKLVPHLFSNEKTKKNVEMVLRMIVSKGIDETLKTLNIKNSTLKSAIQTLCGNNSLLQSETSSHSQSVEYKSPCKEPGETKEPSNYDVTNPVCTEDNSGNGHGHTPDDDRKPEKVVTRRKIRPCIP